MFLSRVALALALALTMAACAAGRQADTVTPPIATAQATARPDVATPVTSRPVESPTSGLPDASPQLAATPAPTAPPSPTATAIPAATATPASGPTAQPAQSPQAERRYVFPVRSEGEVSYDRFHHDYPAVDIFCPVGSEFLAVIGGVVDYVSVEDQWDPAVDDGASRGGISVAIVGDDGVRYYGSHLSRIADGIAPGVRVTAGQVLGLTGKSGNARGTDAHLHFGISRPTTPDDWQVRRGEVPPYDYLRAWERGENVTPELP